MPNTWSTSSALRHSMMASTARMTSRSFRGGRHDWPGSQREDESNSGFSRSERISCGTRSLGEVQIGSAAHAHLVGDRDHVAAFRALPQRVVLLIAVEERGEDADSRQRGADQEPDEERASLHASDGPGRDAEDESDEKECHLLKARAGPRSPRTRRPPPRRSTRSLRRTRPLRRAAFVLRLTPVVPYLKCRRR